MIVVTAKIIITSWYRSYRIRYHPNGCVTSIREVKVKSCRIRNYRHDHHCSNRHRLQQPRPLPAPPHQYPPYRPVQLKWQWTIPITIVGRKHRHPHWTRRIRIDHNDDMSYRTNPTTYHHQGIQNPTGGNKESSSTPFLCVRYFYYCYVFYSYCSLVYFT